MISVSKMRSLDRWLGVPLCVLLTGVCKARDRFSPTMNGLPRRIVFVKLAEQGSTVLAVSAVRRAIEMVGYRNVYFVVFADNRFILDAMNVIAPENVLTIRSDRLSGVIRDTFRVMRQMKKLRVDTAIDLEFFARSSALLTYLSGASFRVGFHAFGGEGPYRGDLMTHRLRFNPYLHTSQIFRMLVEALHVPADQLPTCNLLPVPADELPPVFEPAPQEVKVVREILHQASGTERVEPLILLNANCSDLLPLRRWPADRYVELAKRLIAHYPEIRVAMTGSPPEAPAVAELVDQVRSPRCFSLGGRTTLRQLLVVYGIAEVLVTNDSGPAHFAALTDIDVVTLFGPENPKLFAARTSRNHVFWEGITCSPCLSAFNNRTSHCRNNLCMQRIDIDPVFNMVCQLYNTRRQNAANSHANRPPLT